MLGMTCSIVMRSRPLPAAWAARQKSRAQICRAEARASRAKTGMMKMPMAVTAVAWPGPKMLVTMMAVMSAGKAKMTSAPRMATSSKRPRSAAAQEPRATPASRPSSTARKAVVREVQVPAISMERTSRPKGSVPSRPAASGGFSRSAIWMRVGLSGVQIRERRAIRTKAPVMAPPVTSAGGQRRAARRADGRCGGLIAHALALSRGSSSR